MPPDGLLNCRSLCCLSGIVCALLFRLDITVLISVMTSTSRGRSARIICPYLTYSCRLFMLSWGITEHLQHSNRDVNCKGPVEVNSSTVDGGCGSSPVSVETYGPQGKPAIDLLLGPGDEAAGADGPGAVSKPAFVRSVLRELSVGLCRGNCVTYTDSQGIKQQCKLCDIIHAPPLSRRRESRPFGAPAAITSHVPTTRGFAPGL
jgi:hypothetical protein